MSDTPKQHDWTKPAAMAIPKGGFFKDKVEQGRYGPIFPKTPACYGFTIIAKIKPGREETVRSYGKKIEETIRSEEHTSELQSRRDLVCRLLLEKKKTIHFADKLSCPVIFFQGLEDKVVPPRQAEPAKRSSTTPLPLNTDSPARRLYHY